MKYIFLLLNSQWDEVYRTSRYRAWSRAGRRKQRRRMAVHSHYQRLLPSYKRKQRTVFSCAERFHCLWRTNRSIHVQQRHRRWRVADPAHRQRHLQLHQPPKQFVARCTESHRSARRTARSGTTRHVRQPAIPADRGRTATGTSSPRRLSAKRGSLLPLTKADEPCQQVTSWGNDAGQRAAAHTAW